MNPDTVFAFLGAPSITGHHMPSVGSDSSTTGRTRLDTLLPLLHRELRAIAAAYLRGERPDHTLQRTALVNEAYLRLRRADATPLRTAEEVIGAAARSMRQVLVDHARARKTRKRGGGKRRVPLDDLDARLDPDPVDVLAVDDALRSLARESTRAVTVVEMRFFGGLTVAEVARALDVTERTIERDWRFAQAWLRRSIDGPREP